MELDLGDVKSVSISASDYILFQTLKKEVAKAPVYLSENDRIIRYRESQLCAMGFERKSISESDGFKKNVYCYPNSTKLIEEVDVVTKNDNEWFDLLKRF